MEQIESDTPQSVVTWTDGRRRFVEFLTANAGLLDYVREGVMTAVEVRRLLGLPVRDAA